MWIHNHSINSKHITDYPEAIVQTIFTGLTQCLKIFGKHPDVVITPYTTTQLQWLYNNSDSWAILKCTTNIPTECHLPKSPLLTFFSQHPVIFPRVITQHPLPNALTVFTDGSSNGIAAVVTQEESNIFTLHIHLHN